MKKKCFFYFFVEHALPRAAGDKILQNTTSLKLRETKFYRTRPSPNCGRQNSTEHALPQVAGDKILQNTTFPKLREAKFYRTRPPSSCGRKFSANENVKQGGRDYRRK
ncbi:hypothetical protein HMPREF9072_02513 [Capnocytophaga sp. oral taxon 324 str. F0483]|nr:hypothetical protein HMPREF9072_02513 [Capnocytophaga sp. oral taxon 324 str. F0483]